MNVFLGKPPADIEAWIKKQVNEHPETRVSYTPESSIAPKKLMLRGEIS